VYFLKNDFALNSCFLYGNKVTFDLFLNLIFVKNRDPFTFRILIILSFFYLFGLRLFKMVSLKEIEPLLKCICEAK
jgi:hypothetical protein